MYFSNDNDELVYILVSIKICVNNYMHNGPYHCDVLDCSTGTWWVYDNEKITYFRGYPDNFYNGLLQKS